MDMCPPVVVLLTYWYRAVDKRIYRFSQPASLTADIATLNALQV